MAISKGQFKAANAREAAAMARGPIARAARYDSRRGLIVIALEGGCEFASDKRMRSRVYGTAFLVRAARARGRSLRSPRITYST